MYHNIEILRVNKIFYLHSIVTSRKREAGKVFWAKYYPQGWRFRPKQRMTLQGPSQAVALRCKEKSDSKNLLWHTSGTTRGQRYIRQHATPPATSGGTAQGTQGVEIKATPPSPMGGRHECPASENRPVGSTRGESSARQRRRVCDADGRLHAKVKG